MAFRLKFAALALAFLATTGVATAASGSGDLMTAVKNVASQADKFRSMMSNLTVSQFHFVSITSVLGSSDQPAFQSSLHKNASQIADLRDTLNHTTLTGMDGVVTTLRKVMQAQDISIERVDAVSVGSDSTITLYYQ